jgi:endonuclease/exonuclease/phosphatase family metal-dependent hydrolase
MVKVLTINILTWLGDWHRRRSLLIDGLAAEKPDLVGLQEINMTANSSDWIAKQIGLPYVYLVPGRRVEGHDGDYAGNAILSRYPFVQTAELDLQTQGRVAQLVQVHVDDQPLVFCNGHYYWHPGPHPNRVKQIERLLEWLGQLPSTVPIVAVGDFNEVPHMPAIALLKQHFASAHEALHHCEPDYTCPTPLAPEWHKPFRGTLDYVFINQLLRVHDCRVVLNQHAPRDPLLYPSDHFGIAAELEILSPSNQP